VLLAVATRAIGRVAPERFEAHRAHGYDIVSNKPLRGMDARPVFDDFTTKKGVRTSSLLLSRSSPI
jgi:hypothetical protein